VYQSARPLATTGSPLFDFPGEDRARHALFPGVYPSGPLVIAVLPATSVAAMKKSFDRRRRIDGTGF